MRKITTDFNDQLVESLKVGEEVLISGTIYTARDAAHKLIVECIERNEALPFDLMGSIIYYAGPTPPKPEKVIGSCGPTTSGRMDAYAPRLMEKGMKGMIGKGGRTEEVIHAMKKYKCVYFASIGGAAALIADAIKTCEVIAYPELGPEAVRKLTVVDYPCIVAIDVFGNDIYEMGVNQYKIT